MLLAVDVGNTFVKTAVFEQDTLLDKRIFHREDIFDEVEFILNNEPKIKKIVVASVGTLDKKDFLFLKKRSKSFLSQKKVSFRLRIYMLRQLLWELTEWFWHRVQF